MISYQQLQKFASFESKSRRGHDVICLKFGRDLLCVTEAATMPHIDSFAVFELGSYTSGNLPSGHVYENIRFFTLLLNKAKRYSSNEDSCFNMSMDSRSGYNYVYFNRIGQNFNPNEYNKGVLMFQNHDTPGYGGGDGSYFTTTPLSTDISGIFGRMPVNKFDFDCLGKFPEAIDSMHKLWKVSTSTIQLQHSGNDTAFFALSEDGWQVIFRWKNPTPLADESQTFNVDEYLDFPKFIGAVTQASTRNIDGVMYSVLSADGAHSCYRSSITKPVRIELPELGNPDTKLKINFKSLMEFLKKNKSNPEISKFLSRKNLAGKKYFWSQYIFVQTATSQVFICPNGELSNAETTECEITSQIPGVEYIVFCRDMLDILAAAPEKIDIVDVNELADGEFECDDYDDDMDWSEPFMLRHSGEVVTFKFVYCRAVARLSDDVNFEFRFYTYASFK